MMPPFHLTRLELTLFVLLVAALLGWLAWLAAFFYRQIQIDRLSESFGSLPNEFSRFEVVDGVKLHYLVQGRGPDILLLHGLAANVFVWRDLMPALAVKARVWALDIKGFGLSDKPKNSKYDLVSQAELIRKFMESKGVEKYAVVGNSMGGAIAAEMAIQKPEVVHKLILINSAHDPAFIPMAASSFKFAMGGLGYATWLLRPLVIKEMAEIFIQKRLYGSQKTVPAEVVNAYIRPYMQGRASFHAFVKAFAGLSEGVMIDKMESLAIKPLILLGRNDRIIPYLYGQKLHQRIPGSRLEIHPSGGHHLQEEDALWISSHILEFIGE